MKKSYDILIIGCGPAGSSAAAAACSLGLRVLVVEAREIIGKPVRCAEYIPAQLLREVKIGRDFIVQPADTMKTVLPDGDIQETRAPGYIIRRDLFDQALSRKAEELGSEIWLSTRAVSIDEQGVEIRRKNGNQKVRARVIIGADGPHSKAGKWINSVNSSLIPSAQMSFELSAPMDHTEVYFDRDIYGGYGWLFPKGEIANVGIGMRTGNGGTGSLSRMLEGFVSRLKKEGKIKGGPLAKTAGWIPAEPPRRVVTGNILLAGDAAGHTHSITGAGVAQAIMCGNMAGKWAARAVEADDLMMLEEYEKEWRELYEETLNRAYNRRQLLEKEWDNLNNIIRRCWVGFREYYAEP
jgi:geranylgeranyl reductase family protein